MLYKLCLKSWRKEKKNLCSLFSATNYIITLHRKLESSAHTNCYVYSNQTSAFKINLKQVLSGIGKKKKSIKQCNIQYSVIAVVLLVVAGQVEMSMTAQDTD